MNLAEYDAAVRNFEQVAYPGSPATMAEIEEASVRLTQARDLLHGKATAL